MGTSVKDVNDDTIFDTAGSITLGVYIKEYVLDGLAYEPSLGNPPVDGYLLSSTALGSRSWVAPAVVITDHTLLSNIGSNTHAQIDSHIADVTTNPHNVTAAQVGADPTGTASTAISNHVAEADPHTQYHNDARGDARYLKLDCSNDPLTSDLQINGGLYLEGTTGLTPVSGAGTRMMWIPSKGAFRAGVVNGTQWDDASIGTNSVAFGSNNIADGTRAFVAGRGNTGTGTNSTTMGNGITNSGLNTVAMGSSINVTSPSSAHFGTNHDDVSTVGNNFSAGNGNIFPAGANTCSAFGSGNGFSGAGSFASGVSNNAYGASCSAFGQGNVTGSSYATAGGFGNTASANGCTAFGLGNNASSFAYNTCIGNGNTAAGFASVSLGNLNASSGFVTASILLGSNNVASQSATVGLGTANNLAGASSVCIGNTNVTTAVASYSALLGGYLKSSASNASCLGTGISAVLPMVNSTANTLQIGMNSDEPTMTFTNSGGTTGSIGKVGIGTKTPTARLQLMAGTATANTAPLKFTTGTSLTTPEAGVIEYDGDHFLATTDAGTRQSIVTANNIKTTSTNVDNTVTETTIYSKTFLANELHTDHVIRLTISGEYTNASASDDFTVRFKFGGTTFHAVARIGGNQTNAGWEATAYMTVRSTGATGTAVDFVKFNDNEKVYASSDTTVHTIDTTVSNTFEVTMQWDNAKAGNLFTCTQGFIESLH